jgi:subtilisin-like proprotein convertase family protein
VQTDDTAYGTGLVGSAPVAVSDSFVMDEDGTLVITPAMLLANDYDPDGTPLRIIAVTQPANGTLTANANGTWTYAPDADWHGTDSFSYTVVDGDGRTATARVNIEVRSIIDLYNYVGTGGAITDNAITRFTILVGEAFTVAELELKLTSTHPAPNELRFALVAPNGTRVEFPRTGGPSLAFARLQAQGTWTLEVTDTVRRNTGTLQSWSLAIREGAPNQLPVAAEHAFTTAEDTARVITAASLLAGATDGDGDVLTITAWTQPANGTLARLASGDFSYTPNRDWHGIDTFSYNVSDGYGGSAQGLVSVTVTPVNDAPVAVNDSVTTPRNEALVIQIADLLANDTDIDGDVLSLLSFGKPGKGTLVDNGDGTLTYTPTDWFFGTDTFTYTISDGQGGTASATVTISVTRVNSAPAAGNDAVTTPEDTALVMTAASLLANDTDYDRDTLSISAWTTPANGTLTRATTGNFTYTPKANWFGIDTFTYTVSDGYGGTATATVAITVTPVNDAPVARNDSFTTNQNIPLTFTPLQLLNNDTDIDGDALSVTAWTVPTRGTLVRNTDGSFTYTPNTGFHGTDSFSYTISDGQLTASATVTIVVRQTSGSYTATPNANIADGGTSRFTLTVNDTGTLTDLNVTLNITHPALNELSVFLIGPSGTKIQLIGGLSGANLTNTTLDNDVSTLITSGTAPYTGVWRVADLAKFEGQQVKGNWTLEITDNRKKNAGKLLSWTLDATFGSAMTAASFAPASADIGPAPTLDEIKLLADAAIQRWYSDGSFSAELLARIDNVRFEIVDLPGQLLAFTTWDVIYIDASAAGFGWFIDQADTAFTVTSEEGALSASTSSVAAGRMDLLTVLGHELGNLLGLQDKPAGTADLMSATLEAGTRLELDVGASVGAASAATASALHQQLIMARAAAAWASAMAHDAHYMPAFSALWMPGLFFGTSFTGKSLRSDGGRYIEVAARSIASTANWVELRLSLHEARGDSNSGLLERFLE